MAYPILSKDTKIGVEEEVTEGTYVAPSGATSYVQPLEGYSFTPGREVIDRPVIRTNLDPATPKMGIKSVTAVVPVECRASGTAGGQPDHHSLLKSAFGSERSIAAAVTSGTGHTSTVINIEDADISDFSVGDVVMVKESGAFELRPITAVDDSTGAANITLAFALDGGAPADNVDIEAVQMYHTAQSGHVPLSISQYLGNELRAAGLGMKVTSLALENFTPGQIPSWNFQLEGIGYTYTDGAAPHTPTFDSATPPVVLSACIWRDGVDTKVQNFSLSMANQFNFLTSTCSADGREKSVITGREITGSFDPYTDDTSVDHFTDWEAGTEFSIFLNAYTPSGTAGEITLGSAVGIWIPKAICTEFAPQDSDGVFVDQMSFRVVSGEDGATGGMYLGLV